MAILEEPFASPLKLEVSQRQTLNTNWAKKNIAELTLRHALNAAMMWVHTNTGIPSSAGPSGRTEAVTQYAGTHCLLTHRKLGLVLLQPLSLTIRQPLFATITTFLLLTKHGSILAKHLFLMEIV